MPPLEADTRITGLLFSGGLDSSILLGELISQGYRVQPLYIRTGCQWECAERHAADQFIEALGDHAIQPLVELQMPVEDLYGAHWSTTGNDVPDETTPDEAVHLLGWNPLLLLKAALWCHSHGIPRLALATLACNPFADSTSHFFQQFEQMIETATGENLEIFSPFSERSKNEILGLGFNLPLELTFSCLDPVNNRHCGTCNKCAERARAFASMRRKDPFFPTSAISC